MASCRAWAQALGTLFYWHVGGAGARQLPVPLMAWYNQLLRIEEELWDTAVFRGARVFYSSGEV